MLGSQAWSRHMKGGPAVTFPHWHHCRSPCLTWVWASKLPLPHSSHELGGAAAQGATLSQEQHLWHVVSTFQHLHPACFSPLVWSRRWKKEPACCCCSLLSLKACAAIACSCSWERAALGLPLHPEQPGTVLSVAEGWGNHIASTWIHPCI